MNNSKEIRVGALLSYFQMGVGVIISLLYTPLMIKALGKSEYGLYSTVFSTISMLSILNLGFNSSYIRYYSIYKKKNDNLGIAKLNGLFMIIFLIIAVIGLFCGLFITNNLELLFKNGLTISEYKIGKILMLLLTINLTISFPMTVFTNIITAHEKFVFFKIVSILKTVFSPLLTIPLLLNGFGSIAIVTVTLFVSMIADVIYLIYCFKNLKCSFVFKNFEKGLFKDVVIFTSFLAINLIVDQINLNIDKVLLGRYKGTGIVAVYSVGFTLYTYFQMFSTSISSVFTPRVYALVNNYTGDKQKNVLTELFVKVGRIQFLILSCVCTGIIFFGKSFILNFWAGNGYNDSYYVLLLLAIPAMVPLTQNIGIEIQRAENKHKFRSIVYVIMALFNLILSIYLCQILGAVGCAIGTCASFILANGILINIYYQKKCNIDVVAFWKNILKMSKGLVLPILFGSLINIYVNTSSMFIFALWVFLYSLIFFISMWFFSMNEYEKYFFKKLIIKNTVYKNVKGKIDD